MNIAALGVVKPFDNRKGRDHYRSFSKRFLEVVFEPRFDRDGCVRRLFEALRMRNLGSD